MNICMYVVMYVYVYVYMYICMHMVMYVYVCMQLCMYICIYICICSCIFVYVYMYYVYICMCNDICVCIYVCIHRGMTMVIFVPSRPRPVSISLYAVLHTFHTDILHHANPRISTHWIYRHIQGDTGQPIHTLYKRGQGVQAIQSVSHLQSIQRQVIQNFEALLSYYVIPGTVSVCAYDIRVYCHQVPWLGHVPPGALRRYLGRTMCNKVQIVQ